jgi:hypothetical protein
MISAGETPAQKIRKSIEAQTKIMCGTEYGYEQPGCTKKATDATDAALKELDEGKQQEAFSNFYKLGSQTMFSICQQTLGLRLQALTAKDQENLSKCTAAYVLADKALRFRYADRPFITDFIPSAVDLAKIEGPQPEDVPIPQSLRDYIKSLNDAGAKPFGDLALRLFREGLAKVDPASERFGAAQPIANQVEADVKKRVLPTLGADGKPDPKKVKAAEDGLNYVFVLKTGPKGTDPKKAYPLTIQQAPADLMKAFAKYPPEVKREVMRLFGQALEKAGDKADPKSVADALIKAVDEKLKGVEPKNAADKLGSTVVDTVTMDKEGKNAESIGLKDLQSPAAPQDLIDALDAGSSHAKRYLLNNIWRQIRGNLKGQNIEMDSDFIGKLITNLTKDKKDGGIKDMDLAELAAVEVRAADKNGKVVMEQVPAAAFGDAVELAKRRLPASSAQVGDAMMRQKIAEIYIAAHKADPKIKPEDLAKKVNKAADNNLNPDKVKETDGAIVVRNFLGMEFSKFDKDGNIILKYKKGFDPEDCKGNCPGPVYKESLGEGVEFLFGVDSSLALGGVIGVDRPDGDETSNVLAVAAARARIGVIIDKKYTIDTGLGAIGIYSPSKYTVGLPNGDRSVAVNDDDGAYAVVGLRQLDLGFTGFFGRKEDGTLDDVTFQLGRIAAGHQSGYIDDGTGLALPDDLDPINSYQPFSSPGGSRTLGITIPVTIGISPVKGAYASEASEGLKITPRFILGSASSNINNKETYVGGLRVGGDLQFDIDGGGLAGFEGVGWRILAGGGVQHTSGDKKDVVDALTATSFAVGASTMIQPIDFLQIALGGGYGQQDADLTGVTHRAVFGGNVMFPIKMADGKWSLIPGAGLSYETTWRDQQVAGTPRDSAEEPAPPNPGCEPGYDCPGTAVDVGEGAGDRVSVLGPEYDFLTMGHNILAVNAMLGFAFEAAPWLKPFAGLSIFNVTTHETDASDLVFMPRAGVKVDY